MKIFRKSDPKLLREKREPLDVPRKILLSKSDVQEILNLSRASLDKLRREDFFPQPALENPLRWHRSDVEAWARSDKKARS